MADMKKKVFVSDDARLISEWDWDKNSDISPYKLTVGSNTKAWWIGTCGHTWIAAIKSRNIGRGCPYCAGISLLKGFNDLQTLSPHIAQEWDIEKNHPLLPTDVFNNSHTKVWWLCKNGHNWQASPNHRVSKGRGCPYCCHNPKVLIGVNDFQTIHPDIAREWHPTKNGLLSPNQFTANSDKSFWWRCIKGHEWKTSINHRSNGSNCPFCNQSLQTSFPEQAIYYYIRKAYPDTINGYTELFNNHGMELDIYIPSQKTGIEYDGLAFHRSKVINQREIQKYSVCKKNDIFLIRIREDESIDTSNICDKSIFVKASLDSVLFELIRYLPKLAQIEINIEKDDAEIRQFYYTLLRDNSLETLYPDLCKEWNYEQNKELTPNMFLPHSKTKVWWICSLNHTWKAEIDSRTYGRGCPYCSNVKVLLGYNDLESTSPDLIKEWDFSKNTFSPASVVSGSRKKAWWLCSKCGKSWLAEISSRSRGHGCPSCTRKLGSSKRVSEMIKKSGSLADRAPHLAAEWHPYKNLDLSPTQFALRARKKVWWQCSTCGNEWEAKICDRSYGTNCPICSRKKKQ